MLESYSFERLSEHQVIEILRIMSPQFDPPLSADMNIDEYAKKLSDNATFVLCKNVDIIALIAYYKNMPKAQIYIPLVWVDQAYRGNGISRTMFNLLLEKGKKEGFNNSELEVLKANNNAIKLYNSLGNIKEGEHGNKYLMRYNFDNTDI